MVETTGTFRRTVGTILSGVGTGANEGQPLAGARLRFTASVKEARSDALHFLDAVEARTDDKAVLTDAVTGAPGVWLLRTDNPALGVVGWTWKVEVWGADRGPRRDRFHTEFYINVPDGTGDLDLATVIQVPAPGEIGEQVLVWEQAVADTLANVEEAKQLVKDTAVDFEVVGDDLVYRTRGGAEYVAGEVRGPAGQDGSNVLPTKEVIAANIGDMQNGTVIRNIAATRNVLGRVWTRGNS